MKWVAAACLSSGACGWVMAEPTDVISISEELPVKDRSSFQGALANEAFKLGSYQVADVDRKWNSTSSSEFWGFESAKTKGGYSFNLVGADAKLKGECATEDKANSQNLGGGFEKSATFAKLGCRCSDANGAVTLTIAGGTGEHFEGEVSAPELSYKVLAIHERAKGPSSSDPLGYRIDSDSAPIGAVDLKRPGKVWISKAVAGRAREEIACMFAGLLLYMPPNDNLK